MPEFRNREISIAFDLFGCPNRCRHCWLGKASRKTIPLEEAVRAFTEARQRVRDGALLPLLERVRFFGSHVREKELELNGGIDYAADFELLSVWRLARDPGYGKWAGENYGNPGGERVYLSDSDLRQLWLEMHCEAHWEKGEPHDDR